MSVELIPHDDPYADIVFADPKPKHVNVTIGGERYRLHECTEGAYLDYEAVRAKSLSIEDGVMKSTGEVVQAEASLLAACLRKVNGGPDSAVTEAVAIPTVRAWTARVVQPLVARLKIISGISDLETADQLEKRIAADQKKLEKLRAGKAGDTGPKGSPPDSPGTSGSAPSGDGPSENSLTGKTAG